MRKYVIAMFAASLVAGLAEAQQQQQPGTAGSQPPGVSQQQPGGTGADQPGAAHAVASGFHARVIGQVESVDKESGMLTISTPQGPLSVTFPSSALQHVNQGDRVTLLVSLATSDMPAGSEATPGATGTPGTSAPKTN